MRLRLLAVAGAILSVSAFSATAATLDFVAEAAGNERGVADNTIIDNANMSNLAITFSANGGNFAYFDDLSGGRPAGLGVCPTLTGSNQCTPSSDDNIKAGEEVFLKVEQDAGSGFLAGILNTATFYDHEHKQNFSGDFDYSLDGGTSWITAALSGGFNFGGAAYTAAGIGFRFTPNTGQQFYVGNLDLTPSQVPIPAGGLLLLTGFGGLIAMKRRRKS